MTDEKFDLEKYLQMLEESGLSEASAGEESTTKAPEQGETEKQGLLERLRRWVRRRASARASAPTANNAPNVDVSSNTPDASSEAQQRTRAQAELPPAQPDSRTDIPDGGNSAVSAAQQPKRADALPLAPHSRDVVETSSGCGTRSGGADEPLAPSAAAQADDSLHLPPAARAVGSVSHTPAQPEPERTAGEVAPSERAPSPPERGGADERFGTDESPRVAQQRAHAQPATSPPQSRDKHTSYPGEVAGGSVAPRPNRAPSAPQPRPSLHSLTRALDRELRRYG